MDSWKKRLKERIDCVLDTKEKKIGFAVIFTVCTLALWYAIAAIHVGFAYEDDSFLGLVRYYITGGHRFPWGVLLAFQAIFLFGGYALMQDHNIDIKAKALYAYYASNNALAPKDRIALRYIQDQFPVCESAADAPIRSVVPAVSVHPLSDVPAVLPPGAPAAPLFFLPRSASLPHCGRSVH